MVYCMSPVCSCSTILILIFVGSIVSFGGSCPWNMSAIFLSASSLSVSIGTNGASGVRFLNVLISYVDVWVSDLAKEILDILVFSGNNSTVS